jgi:hypothetical protein
MPVPFYGAPTERVVSRAGLAGCSEPVQAIGASDPRVLGKACTETDERPTEPFANARVLWRRDESSSAERLQPWPSSTVSSHPGSERS